MSIESIDELLGFSTLGIRAAELRTEQREHSPAIFPTSSFVFGSAAEAAAVFKGDQPGNVYARFTNPTVQAFERRLAILEGGDACVATASGMAAILSLGLTVLKAGDHLLASSSLFGSTISLFNQYFVKFGVEVSYVDLPDLEAWQAAMRPNTRLLFAETPSNPLTQIVDIEKLAAIAHAGGALLAIDNCFLTPVFQQPLKLGADFVVHSATKFLDGQGRCVGGAVVGDSQRVGKDLFGFMRTAGPCMSPFNAWVFLKGLETLAVRLRAHEASARELARFLDEHPGIDKVYHASLPSHPQHALALHQQGGFGAIVSFEAQGGQARAWAIIDALKLCSITANLGDTRTTVTHPATTTHGRISPEARAAAGIGDALVRIAVGLEDVEDLIRDFDQALEASR